jgi:RHS repeat-associated protein
VTPVGNPRAGSPQEGNGAAAGGPPALSLPRGGGAIRGIGESFRTNPATGTASMSVPITVSPARGEFVPRLALSYDSGSGNGPFGFGWTLSLARIERLTDKGLPRYLDADESDAFLLSGAEELVPTGADTEVDGHAVRRYRPRVDTLFARIERWTRKSDGATHWRSITRDNVTNLYGTDDESRIQDPGNPAAGRPARVFAWLICESYDDKGNGILYEYAREDSEGVDTTRAHEARRTDASRGVNRYLKRIRYGNVVSRLDPNPPADWRDEFLFELVFDYGEGHCRPVPPASGTPVDEQMRLVRAAAVAPGPWSARPDPFSSHRAAFEVRTYRRCRRILMFHRFAELGTEPCLVRSTELDYADLDYGQAPGVDAELAHQGSTRFASFVRSITQSGFARAPSTPPVEIDGATYVTYVARSMPPLEFEYGKAQIDDEVRVPDADAVENMPIGLSGRYRLVDLDGEGVAGVLSEHDGGWYYKPGLGDARFGPQEVVASRPALGTLGGARQLVDLDGDGQLDLMVLDDVAPGFHERTDDGDWKAFRAFVNRPTIGWDDPNVRLVDLNGDGLADVLMSEDEAFACYQSLGEDGFDEPERTRTAWDEDEGPRLVLADRSDSVYLADMSGDGLSDLVRIRNGEVCYWPSLGYARFGPKVTMDGSPWFDEPDRFDHARIQVTDVDGSGANDIVYLGADGARLYLNRSGNEWTGPRLLGEFPPVDRLSSVTTADLFGRGTACLVWSTPLPGRDGAALRYLDLMAGGKPHMLTRVINNLGSETHVHYAASTRFYLADKQAGRPWATRLPFPVQVVERVETHDRVSGNRFVSRFAYHHGHFDGVEREFRGFGQVDEWDTEEWAAMNAGQVPGGSNFDSTSDVPPVLTRTWFHTGAFAGRDLVSRAMADEYYRDPGLTDAQAQAMLLDDTPLPAGLDTEEEREACRALKGSTLRREVYGLDGTPSAAHPYTVTEQSFTIRRLQPRGSNRHAVFVTHPRESIVYEYERQPADPRVKHKLTLQADDFTNERRSATVAYPRRTPDMALDARERAKQAQLRIVYTENDYTNPIDAADDHRAPLPSELRTYDVTGIALPAGRVRFAFADLDGPPAAAVSIGYEQAPTPGLAQKRLIECVRTIYRRDDLTGPLALGALESRALPFDGYKLAFTPGLISSIYGARVTDAMMGTAGFQHSEGDANWWVPTGRLLYSPRTSDTAAQELVYARQHFFQPCRYRDPFHSNALNTETRITYDAYDLLPQETRDPVGNRVTAGERDLDPNQPLVSNGIDYRVLKPALVMDPNRNRARVAFDALGLVVATALAGKPEDLRAPGDDLDGVAADLTEAQVVERMSDPIAGAGALLGRATTRFVYDVLGYYRTRGLPRTEAAGVLTLARETHDSDLSGGTQSAIQYALSYSDGFAREIQKKTRVEPGGGVDPRWVGSGWQVFNNKGKVVREYEPFFTDTHAFEFDVQAGVSPIRFYDPVERLVATLYPNHTWDKSAFDAWGRETWDPNDTVLIADPATDRDVGGFFRRLPVAEYTPTWHARRSSGALGADEQAAARKAAVHAATPSILAFDSMGQTVLVVGHNAFLPADAAPADPRTEERYATRTTHDVEGNIREVVDAKDRLIARLGYDMLGNCVRKESMEAGKRVTLENAAGKPDYTWDGLDRRLHTVYDALRRPIEVRLREGAGPEVVVERSSFGEGAPSPEASNLRQQMTELRDQAGLATMPEYDFKGNLTRSTRRFAVDYDVTINWSGAVPLDATTYEHRTSYDALNRPVELVTPDGSTVAPRYNQAGLVERVDAAVRGAASEPFVTSVAYDARGKRTLVELGNGARTSCEYDPETFRLVRMTTTRAPATLLQDLRYTSDPVGNITHVADGAQQDVFFRNRRVEPSADYTYDAIYQLIEATGREHLAGGAPSSFDDAPRVGLVHPHDGNALGRYREHYSYDEVGNFLELLHRGTDPVATGWTRSYTYDEPSQLEPARRSNRLTSTAVGAATEIYSSAGDGYDADGNMLRMPHLQSLEWEFRDRLRVTERQGERTYCVYDPDGTRMRKVTERADGQLKDERRYMGGFEVYIRAGPNGLVRETLHVRDGDRPVALVETRTDVASPSLVRYQLADQLDSVRIELDDQAQVISYEEYTPFGATALQAADPQLTAPKRYRYTGRERDDESGLCHHGARYYAPWLGRWTAPDPEDLKDSINLYVYVRNRPTGLVDPNGRAGVKPEALAPIMPGLGSFFAASATGGSGSGPKGSGSATSGPGVIARVTGAIGRFFDAIAGGLAKVADVLAVRLPGIIAGPLAGVVDILGGFFRVLGGSFSWKGGTILKGLKEMGLGALRIIGLKEVVTEKWDTPAAGWGMRVPKTLAGDIAYARGSLDILKIDAWRNGFKAWHAATNAVLTQRLGPVAVPFLFLAGLFHESPLDWKSFKAEQKNQGTVNHILDSLLDIVANVFGMVIGLIAPRKFLHWNPAVAWAAYFGRYAIPGPADRDPEEGGVGPAYSGNPLDAWWKWKKDP